MQNYLIRNARIVNEGRIIEADLLIVNGRIEKIGSIQTDTNVREIDARGQYLFPGAIDDQVHFREPGLTHKANIYTESRAAVAGGVTSFMEMPNTIPPALPRKSWKKNMPLPQPPAWGTILSSWVLPMTMPMKYCGRTTAGRISAVSRSSWVPPPVTCWSIIT